MGSKSKRGSSRGRRSSKQDVSDDNSVSAVLQGTQNDRGMSRSSAAAEQPTIAEGGGDGSRARILDPRRISVLCATLLVIVVVVVVAVGSTGGFAKPPPGSFETATATPPHPTEDGLPHLHKYAYVFVAYDKIGFTVAHQMYEQLERSMEELDKGKHPDSYGPSPDGGHLKEQWIDSRSEFNTTTLCTDMNLESSTVTILESPQFHCNMQKLRSLFMDHDDLTREKWGVKVVHLVRNPFSMAVANYQEGKDFHAHEEVRFKHPCNSLTESFSMNMKPKIKEILIKFFEDNGIMTHEDLDGMTGQCKQNFQSQPGLETASYQQHLDQLPPAKGLRLAAMDRLNGIALMAKDLIAFDWVKYLVQEEASNPDRKKVRHFDLMTLPMDTVVNYPGNAMYDFLDFVFGEHMSESSKRKAAAEYEKARIVEESAGATEVEELAGILRNDPLFGGPLARMESLLDQVLSDE